MHSLSTPHPCACGLLTADGENCKRCATMQAVGRIIETHSTMREGTAGTPLRVARFYEAFLNPLEFEFTTFENEGDSDEMIVQKGIPFYSLCEHHMLPFFGTAVVAYIPGKRIVGLSKLARCVQSHASGLQNQERITQQVCRTLMEKLEPKGVGVVLTARHMCMEMRGVKAPGTETTTSSLAEAFKADSRTRSEFLTLAGVL